MEFLKMFQSAVAVSTPLIGVRTADPASTVRTISSAYGTANVPILYWDVLKGISGYNKLGAGEVKKLLVGEDGEAREAVMVTARPTDALIELDKFLGKMKTDWPGIVFMANAHLFWKEETVLQGVWNLRDIFKAKGATLVMLISAGANLPTELSSDIFVLDEPLPTRKELEGTVVGLCKAAGIPQPNSGEIDKATDALIGLAAFPAEQTLAMSITPKGIKFDQLWERKRKVIEQTRGLTVWRGGDKFVDIGGCENVKGYFSRLLKGNDAPTVVVFIDEIEKMFAGAGTDTSGVTTKMMGEFLSWMEDRKAMGSLFIGPPGSGKTMVGRAIGNEGQILTVGMSPAAMETSLVGATGENFRNATKMVDAVAGGMPILVVGTCNSIGSLPPEVRRRFTLGTFFFDLPTAAEREVIWNKYLKDYKLSSKDGIPPDGGWTGAEIRNCCKLAWQLGISLKAAKEYIIPVAEQAKDKIEALRKLADGKFISAGKPGVYQMAKLEEVAIPQPARVFRLDPSTVGSA